MRAARFGGKIGHADLDAATGARRPHIGDLPPPDEPPEVAFAVPRDPGSLWEVHDSVSFGEESGLNPRGRPLEGAGGALSAEGLAELLGLGADVGDCFVNSAAVRAQKDTPPEESLALRGAVRVSDYACSSHRKSRPGR